MLEVLILIVLLAVRNQEEKKRAITCLLTNYTHRCHIPMILTSLEF